MINFTFSSEPVLIASGESRLAGVLEFPQSPCGMVLLNRGGGTHGRSPRSSFLADELRRAGLATLLLDLLSADDGRDDQRFDLALLGARLGSATDWLAAEPETRKLALGLYGTGGDAAAAAQLAALRPEHIAALVSCGGRLDLAGAEALERVRAPTLLIVGEEDRSLIQVNREALDRLSCEKDLAVIRGSTHPCREQATLEEVARLSARWFMGYFGGKVRPALRPQA